MEHLQLCKFHLQNCIWLPLCIQASRTSFWCQNGYFWKVSMSHMAQNHWENKLYYKFFSLNLTLEYIQLYKFHLWNFLWTPHAKRIVARKVFLSKMLGKTSIFTLSGKVLLWNVKMMFCVVIWTWMSPLTYWNLNSSSKMLVLQWLLGFMLVYCSQKMKWCAFPKMFPKLLFIETKHTSSRFFLLS